MAKDLKGKQPVLHMYLAAELLVNYSLLTKSFLCKHAC